MYRNKTFRTLLKAWLRGHRKMVKKIIVEEIFEEKRPNFISNGLSFWESVFYYVNITGLAFMYLMIFVLAIITLGVAVLTIAAIVIFIGTRLGLFHL